MLALTPRQATMAVWADLRQARSSVIGRRVEGDARWRALPGCELAGDQLLVAADHEGPLAWVLRGDGVAGIERCGKLKVLRADARTVVLASARAEKRVTALTKRPRRSRTRLGRMLCRAPRPHTVAFAARFGRKSRQRLGEMPTLGGAEAPSSVVGRVDVRRDVRVSVRARLGTRKAARHMAAAIKERLDAWRRQPLVKLSGLGALASSVQAKANGRTTTLEAKLAEAEVLRLMDQMDTLSRISR
jgi:hypothetical protein